MRTDGLENVTLRENIDGKRSVGNSEQHIKGVWDYS